MTACCASLVQKLMLAYQTNPQNTGTLGPADQNIYVNASAALFQLAIDSSLERTPGMARLSTIVKAWLDCFAPVTDGGFVFKVDQTSLPPSGTYVPMLFDPVVDGIGALSAFRVTAPTPPSPSVDSWYHCLSALMQAEEKEKDWVASVDPTALRMDASNYAVETRNTYNPITGVDQRTMSLEVRIKNPIVAAFSMFQPDVGSTIAVYAPGPITSNVPPSMAFGHYISALRAGVKHAKISNHKLSFCNTLISAAFVVDDGSYRQLANAVAVSSAQARTVPVDFQPITDPSRDAQLQLLCLEKVVQVLPNSPMFAGLVFDSYPGVDTRPLKFGTIAGRPSDFNAWNTLSAASEQERKNFSNNTSDQYMYMVPSMSFPTLIDSHWSTSAYPTYNADWVSAGTQICYTSPPSSGMAGDAWTDWQANLTTYAAYLNINQLTSTCETSPEVLIDIVPILSNGVSNGAARVASDLMQVAIRQYAKANSDDPKRGLVTTSGRRPSTDMTGLMAMTTAQFTSGKVTVKTTKYNDNQMTGNIPVKFVVVTSDTLPAVFGAAKNLLTPRYAAIISAQMGLNDLADRWLKFGAGYTQPRDAVIAGNNERQVILNNDRTGQGSGRGGAMTKEFGKQIGYALLNAALGPMGDMAKWGIDTLVTKGKEKAKNRVVSAKGGRGGALTEASVVKIVPFRSNRPEAVPGYPGNYTIKGKNGETKTYYTKARREEFKKYGDQRR